MTHMAFTPHIRIISEKAKLKLKALRTLTGTKFRQEKESSTYNLYTPPLNCSHLPVLPSFQNQTIKLQTTQYSTFRTIISFLATTETQDLHNETKIFPIETHPSVLGTQFSAAALDPSYLIHYNKPPTPK